MPLSKFAAAYGVGKKGSLKNKILKRKKENTVIIFHPHIRNDPNASTYARYCKYALLKYKPWSFDDETMHQFDGVENPTDEDLILMWTDYQISCEADGKWLPDKLQSEIDNRILNRKAIPNARDNSVMDIDDSHIDVTISTDERENTDFLEMINFKETDCQVCLLKRGF